jgi:hypothetical protein
VATSSLFQIRAQVKPAYPCETLEPENIKAPTIEPADQDVMEKQVISGACERVQKQI